MRNSKLPSTFRNDAILLGALVLAAVILFCTPFFFGKEGRFVVIEENGREIGRFSITDEVTEEIRTGQGYNTLVIRGGAAWIESADCRDKICIHRGSIRNAGETIVCLPHRLVITVTEGEER